MKRAWFFIIPFFIFWQVLYYCHAQELPSHAEQQLENLADASNEEGEDDELVLQFEQFRKNPVNLNTAGEEELKQLMILSEMNIVHLLSYRQLFGPFIDMYELQAVPGWDLSMIRKLMPFVTIRSSVSLQDESKKRFRQGEHMLLFRVSQVLERAKAYENNGGEPLYLGSPQKVVMRYRYRYKNLLQYGVIGDKDAGERFFKGAQKMGFDFYSFHFFARKLGIIQELALGDFSVSMGQGLIQWQGFAFRKNADAMGINRQSPVIRPYASAGEFYFHRGAAITVRAGKWESSLFLSMRKLSANTFISDSTQNLEMISSFLASGYHRSQNEINKRNNIRQFAYGASMHHRYKKGKLGLQAVSYHFSKPLQKQAKAYNLYAIRGKHWLNASIDYRYTFKNVHLFGEFAADRGLNKAVVNGMLLSLDQRVDLSILYRDISPRYQAIQANAFTENSFPNNEKGLYCGISLRPAAGWKIDAYADWFSFPWLKFGVDAPSRGVDLFMQLVYTPNKQVEILTRFRNERKEKNKREINSITNFVDKIPRQSWRSSVIYKITPVITVRKRVEMVWYDIKDSTKETGYMGYIDLLYKPRFKPYGGIFRIQYFDTEGYNARVYAYENDVLFAASIPAFSGTGTRYYIILDYNVSQNLSLWVKWAQSIYLKGSISGSGPNQLPGNRRSEFSLQTRWIF